MGKRSIPEWVLAYTGFLNSNTSTADMLIYIDVALLFLSSDVFHWRMWNYYHYSFSFIHFFSFISSIYIAPRQVGLLRGAHLNIWYEFIPSLIRLLSLILADYIISRFDISASWIGLTYTYKVSQSLTVIIIIIIILSYYHIIILSLLSYYHIIIIILSLTVIIIIIINRLWQLYD